MSGTDLTDVQITADQTVTLLAVASLGFGAAGVLAPTALRRSYGMTTPAAPGELNYVGRLWGSRTAVIGALALAARGTEQQRVVLTLAAAMNGLDAVTAVTTSSLPARTRVMGALTSGFFAGASAYGASRL